MPRYFYGAAMEQFPPSDLIRQAVEAEQAGFDGVGCSDHFQPWWPDGESGHAWVWLGAMGQATERVAIGSAVTAPVHRYHPATVAQAWATLEEMFPGRAFLGIGSGESLNESPCGMDWPPVGQQIARMEEALEIIHRLFEGEHVDFDGRFFRTKQAYLYTRGERRPPVYVSAFGPQAARVAGRWADGIWCLADPEVAPTVIDAYRAGAEEAGREPGEVVLQVQFSWAESDDEALEAARVWKGAQPDEYYTEDWHDPAKMYSHGEEQVSDDEFKKALIIGSDPEMHVERVRQAEELGATIVALMNVSGAAPHDAIRVYGEKVLPAVRG